MREAGNLIMSFIGKWKNKFGFDSVRYAYDSMSDFHIVEVSPYSRETKSDTFIDEEYELMTQFEDAFIDSNLLISAPSGIHNMTNVIFDSNLSSDFIQMNSIKVDFENVSENNTLSFKSFNEVYSDLNFNKEDNCIIESGIDNTIRVKSSNDSFINKTEYSLAA